MKPQCLCSNIFSFNFLSFFLVSCGNETTEGFVEKEEEIISLPAKSISEVQNEEQITVKDDENIDFVNSKTARYSRAQKMSEKGDHAAAVNEWKELLKKDSSDINSWKGLGYYFRARNFYSACKKIISGLKKIREEIIKNKFKFNKKYEDIHLNIEKRLFQIIGEEAGYIHTARSRNDQVITDFKIWIKSATMEINNSINKVAAIGLRVSKWIAYHGFAINVSNDLSKYKNIVPCGVKDKGITSLKEIGVNNHDKIEEINIKDFSFNYHNN